MNWRVIFSLAGFGVLLGAISVLGLSEELGVWVYGIALITCLWMMTKKVKKRFFWHGLLLGLLIAAIEATIGQLFVSTYLDNNSEMAEAYMWSFGFYFVMVWLVNGLIYGLGLGIASWLVRKFFGERLKPALST